MSKKELPPLTVHSCIWVNGQIVCFDNWPREIRSQILAHAMAPVIPIVNPGYVAAPLPELDVTPYITPEDIVHFPWMDKDTKGR